MVFGLAAAVVKEFHTAQTTAICITAANIAPIMFVKVPLRLSCADLHTRGSFNTIRDCMRPHALLKGSVLQITRPTRLPCATAHLRFPSRAPTHRNFKSRAFTRSHAPSRASTLPLTSLLTASTSAFVTPLLTSLACISRWCHLLTLEVSSRFDHWPLTLTEPLTVDFSPKVDFCSQGSSYPVFHVDFIFVVFFCILCL